MKYLLIFLLLVSGCSMSSREMINDCITEVTPISAISSLGNSNLKDKCYSSYIACLADCYLEKDSCISMHEETIKICMDYKDSLRTK